MCGICGIIGAARHQARPSVERMVAALVHRGPDDVGIYEDDGAVLGHRRLSILDLETGHQPLANEDETLWITFNGEIYNYRELRAALIRSGHRFRTRTDTEVILHLYEEFGADCPARLRGMFAFAIWDRRDRTLFAARDRFGQKPMYYAVHGPTFSFASEIKGLLAAGGLEAEPDPAAVDYYLGLRFIPPPLTMLRGVRKLAAGHRLEWRRGEFRVEPYWRPAFPPAPRRTDADWIAELRDRIEEAVRAHLVSDVPVGAYLSGGMDSGVVVAAMARQSGQPVPTFCIGSDASDLDERRFARLIADRYGTAHHERRVNADLLRHIPEMVRCLDEPSDPIAACMHEAARLASEHVKVVLGGDGGDEVFAGFDRYAAYGWVERYGALPRWVREDLIRPLVERLPVSFGYKSISQRIRWLVAVDDEDPGRRYGRMTAYSRFGPREKAWVYGPALRDQLRTQDALAAVAEPFACAAAGGPLHRMVGADMLTRLPEHTLLLTDRMSMAHGLETRSPLLDPELADFCAAMPPRLKIRRGVTKYVMREAARPWLPLELVRRAKQGFMFPVANWLDDAMLAAISALLGSGTLVEGGWIERSAVHRLVAEHRLRRADHHVRIWMLLNLEAWFEIYIGGRPTRMAALAHAGAG